ncbi:MAG: DinB family protein [Acidobacteria bacterium]|nr:DinB family protein [Acidobacteriota bacterium]
MQRSFTPIGFACHGLNRWRPVFMAAFVLIWLAAWPVANQAQTAESKPKAAEKDYAAIAEHLAASREKFQKALAGLSEEQMRFKSAPERWSIAQVAEHLTLAENFLFGIVTEQILKSPAAPGKERKVTDEMLIAATRSRANKLQAPEPAQPKGTWASVKETMQEFEQRRSRTIAFVKAPPAELRHHFTQLPQGVEVDAAQFILLMSAHTERHTAQIEEVKADPKFPAR